jgi:2-keto-4-pentenoate hydratase/2-oxohepta-3-ene-1,7-dioic acid hydratase in catechol pathway
MRFARIGASGEELPALLDNDSVAYDLSALTPDIDGAFLAGDGPRLAAEALTAGSLPRIAPGQRFGPPLTRVGKIVCAGLNYRAHAAESGAQPPAEPILFLKAADTIVGPDDEVFIPKASVKTDYEVELAVVIGRVARYLDSPADSPAHIAGFTLSNDVSEREFQLERGGQWDKGKSCETFNPLGPVLVTADEINAQDLQMRTWVNGDLRQDSRTSDMIFDINHLVWYISQFMVLRPGDVINTGTPAGVAMGLPGTPYLRDGDELVLEIEGLGRQRQRCRAATLTSSAA